MPNQVVGRLSRLALLCVEGCCCNYRRPREPPFAVVRPGLPGRATFTFAHILLQLPKCSTLHHHSQRLTFRLKVATLISSGCSVCGIWRNCSTNSQNAAGSLCCLCSYVQFLAFVDFLRLHSLFQSLYFLRSFIPRIRVTRQVIYDTVIYTPHRQRDNEVTESEAKDTNFRQKLDLICKLPLRAKTAETAKFN